MRPEATIIVLGAILTALLCWGSWALGIVVSPCECSESPPTISMPDHEQQDEPKVHKTSDGNEVTFRDLGLGFNTPPMMHYITVGSEHCWKGDRDPETYHFAGEELTK